MDFTGVPGHEFVGRVAGPSDSSWLGRRVVGEINCGCGRCPVCLRGDMRHCPGRTVLGIAGRSGAFAEYLVLPESCLVAVPERLSDRQAVFTEPLAAACRILGQVTDLPGDVLVVGDGKLGLLIVQVLSTRCRVSVAGRHPERAARICGPQVRCMRGVPQGRTFRLVIEASGSPAGLETALGAVEPEGTCVLKSTYHGRTAVDFSLGVVVPEVTVVGSRCGPFGPALDLLERGAIATEAMITAEYELERWEEAFRVASEPESLKVLFRL